MLYELIELYKKLWEDSPYITTYVSWLASLAAICLVLGTFNWVLGVVDEALDKVLDGFAYWDRAVERLHDGQRK